MRRVRLVIWIVIVILGRAGLSASPHTIPAEPEFLPLGIASSGLVTVTVNIDEMGPFKFVLDTGSNRTAIADRVAKRASMKTAAKSTLMTANSSEEKGLVRLAAISVGCVIKEGVLAVVLSDTTLASFGRDVDGIIGQDFLIDQNYTIDYGRKRLVWNAGETQPSGIALSLRKDEGRWLVALPQASSGGDVLWFVPDSGAQTFVLFDHGRPSPLQLEALPSLIAGTVGGDAVAKAAVISRLRVGTLQFDDQRAVIIDRRDPDAPAGDGLLPLGTFKSVTFSATTQQLFVTRR